MYEKSVAYCLAQSRKAFVACAKERNPWQSYHANVISWIEEQFLPRGSGYDNGTRFDREKSCDECLVFYTSFHHMNESGMYDSWTEHTVKVQATHCGVEIHVSGRDRNGVKEMIAEDFGNALEAIAYRNDGVAEYGWYHGDEWHKKEIEK